MQLDPRQIWNGIRKRWWLALLVMLSAAAVAYLYENAQPRTYQAQTTIAAKPVITGPEANAIIEAIRKTMPTYAQELASRDLWRQVVDNEPIHDVDLGALPGFIRVQPRPDDNALVMTVDYPRADTAALLADRIANAFVARQLADNQNAGPGGNVVIWSVTQPAEVPSDPYKPRPRLYAFAAALFGLLLGLLLAVGLELLDTTLKSPADVTQYVGLNTIGIIPRT